MRQREKGKIIMNQKKIGEFIAQLRKEQGLTQKELAERVNVSDKTISKWECGNGLPEMSSIPVLCQVLGISINELLSGERLEQEGYTEKAEENIMTLMQESAEHKKKDRSSFVTVLLSLFGVVLTISVTTWFSGNLSLVSFFDLPTLIPMLLVTGIVLVAGGKWKAFCRAFVILRKGIQEFTEHQVAEAREALGLAGKTMLVTGCLLSISTMIYLGAYLQVDSLEVIDQLIKNLSVAFLGMLYGVAGYLFFQPIRSRLMIKEE